VSLYDSAAVYIEQYASLISATVQDGYASMSARLPDGRVLSAHAGPCKDALGKAAWELSAAVRWAVNARAPAVRHRGEFVLGIDHITGGDLLVQAAYGRLGDTAYRRAA
jgi:hypothetical protein